MKVKVISADGREDTSRVFWKVYKIHYDPLHYRDIELFHNGGIDILTLATGESIVIEEEVSTD